MTQRLVNYDRIYRFQGRWIEIRGSLLPVHARYVSWGVYLAAYPATAGLWWLTGSTPGEALFNAMLSALIVTLAVMRYVERDLTLAAVVRIAAAETRLAAAIATRPAPRTVAHRYQPPGRRTT